MELRCVANGIIKYVPSFLASSGVGPCDEYRSGTPRNVSNTLLISRWHAHLRGLQNPGSQLFVRLNIILIFPILRPVSVPA